MKGQLKIFGIVFLVAIIGCFVFISSSYQDQGFGFPLDDAWIHQTFARNLVEQGEWSFQVGHPSSGSTSPFWNLIIAFGYLINIDKVSWVWLTGVLTLVACGVLGIKISQKYLYLNTFWTLTVGVAVVSEWHLIWAALSGMETSIYSAAILLVYYLLVAQKTPWIIGFVIGISVWIRPDALTLVAPVLMVIIFKNAHWKQKIDETFRLLVPIVVILAGYFAFNYFMDGRFFPNTLYAKQMEYHEMLAIPFYIRSGKLFMILLTGIGSILLPGQVWGLVTAIKQKNWTWLAFTCWWAGYIVMYAISLPVVYQHGRYLIPATGVYLINGLIGWMWLISSVQQEHWKSRITLFATSSMLGISLVFLVLGARAYAEDVAIINSEMVTTAYWMDDNLPSNSIIAVHDIGAIGYFTEFEIVDLAGLVTPAIIPILRNEEALAGYMDNAKVEYLVTFPGWYPRLTAGLPVVFQTSCEYSCPAGGEAMTVFRWDLSKSNRNN